ncbi:MAG TPA: hypothetical protein VFQ61_00330 [Polyangiaceae bacterium]|nr:hypothetical protein [Polyangiaceae bacterium]
MLSSSFPTPASLVHEGLLGARAIARRVPLNAALLGWCACFVCAWLTRSRDGGVDDALNVALGLIMPLTAYVSFEGVLDRGRLESAVRGLSRHGLHGKALWLGAAAALLGWLAMISASFAATVVWVSRGVSSDVLLSAWIGAWGGAAYALWFSAASDVGARGQGRKWLLLVDLTFGSTNGFLALPWPRAHVRNLLGGESWLGLQGPWAFALLFVSGLIALAIGFRRAPE